MERQTAPPRHPRRPVMPSDNQIERSAVGRVRFFSPTNRELIGRSDMNHRAEPRGIVKLRKQSGERLQGREREQK